MLTGERVLDTIQVLLLCSPVSDLPVSVACFEQEFATKPLKHLLGKNGTSKVPEFADDIRCEKLLNSLAKQQKKSSVVENSSPPFKRQRLLGVNENNEVIVIDDQLSEPAAQNVKSSPARAVSQRGKPGAGAVGASLTAVPVNGYVASIDPPTKTAPLAKQQPPSSEQTNAAVEVICIDDDEDDVSVGCANIPLNCAERSVIPAAHEAHTNVVVTAESSPADSHVCRTISSDCAVIVDDEQAPLSASSQQAADSRLSSSSAVNGRQQASGSSPAASSSHSSSSSRKVERLENLLKVGMLLMRHLSFC